jgi:hypothetical protein
MERIGLSIFHVHEPAAMHPADIIIVRGRGEKSTPCAGVHVLRVGEPVLIL